MGFLSLLTYLIFELTNEKCLYLPDSTLCLEYVYTMGQLTQSRRHAFLHIVLVVLCVLGLFEISSNAACL